ncbi:prepilin-type N-terminal cleavage/methylation domain-containing protein, partial [Candidatus Gracilibacteria bacterium]|nr:prepilin-type N-terminal cleavage/methylation domain-containing protein [Candidatus Gracilibacteria bacterium]
MIFLTKGKKTGFTLVEILVAISVLAIIILGVSNIQLKSISDGQRVESFAYRIVNHYELIRNNALIGKGIGGAL